MYVEITLDCQTKTDHPSCEYCIAHQECQLQKSLTREKGAEKPNGQLKSPALGCSSK